MDRARLGLVLGVFLVGGCHTSVMTVPHPPDLLRLPDLASAGGSDGPDLAPPDDPLTPPTGQAALEAWLAKGYYKSNGWTCEAMAHDPRPPSAHVPDRICQNPLSHDHGAGEFPVGAASVKELYDMVGGSIVGHAVNRKMSAGGCDTFYWYENSGGTINADGLGNAGTAMSYCVACHVGADPTATMGHDCVYTIVP